jgi:hypothetical protein
MTELACKIQILEIKFDFEVRIFITKYLETMNENGI